MKTLPPVANFCHQKSLLIILVVSQERQKNIININFKAEAKKIRNDIKREELISGNNYSHIFDAEIINSLQPYFHLTRARHERHQKSGNYDNGVEYSA